MRLLFQVGGRIAPRLAARAMATLVSQPRGRNPTQPWELASAPGRRIELRPGLFAEAWGESGPLVLALHGWRGRTTQFRPLAALLLARGIRTVAVDLPGHGGSAGEQLTPHLLGQLLIELQPILGSIHTAIGHSFGGAGIGAALPYGFRPSRIVIVSSPTHVSHIPFYWARMVGLPARAMPHFARLLDQHAGRPIAELDLVSTAPGCGIPGLLVHDTEDAVIPYSQALALVAAWPELQFMTTTGKGHRDILANDAVLQRITEFIAAT